MKLLYYSILLFTFFGMRNTATHIRLLFTTKRYVQQKYNP
jgi:hypothetical protein